MAKDNNGKLRNAVVLGFTLLSVLLVLAIWVERLAGSTSTERPGYIRATISVPTSEGFDLTLTAQPTGHNGQGGGNGGGDHDQAPTASPTFDITNWVTEDVSDAIRDE